MPLLRAGGDDVYTPTLTGLGERAHLGTPQTSLETHILDVVNTRISSCRARTSAAQPRARLLLTK
jgi:hypothetical protein